MWKDYSSDYIKNNRSAGLSVRLAAFISALLLSLLCGLFYNTWKYEVERIHLEDGSWHSRITGDLQPKDIEAIQNFAHVTKVTGTANTVDIIFDDMGVILSDTPRIARLIGAAPEQISYNYELLAMYLIRVPEDPAPRLLFPLFILITLLAALSLIVIIHNAFAVSMNARIRQFGIFSSIGATPKQIRTCLLQESAALCAIPVLIGNILGIAGSMGLMYLSNILLGTDIPGRHRAIPGYHPIILVLTLLITVITIWISAWLPARKLSRLTPLEAIRNTGELQLKHKKSSPILAALFGAEGELAGNALKAQKKSLRTASLSLVFSLLAFTIMQCFVTTSAISTRETYFERYQDAWDIMVTVKDTDVDAFGEADELRKLTGVQSVAVYQKATAQRLITADEMSEEMKSFGGFSHASGESVTKTDDGWLVNAPIMIMDDNSFLDYCQQIGTAPRLDGAIVRNLIRDVTNPDFRHPVFIPYIQTQNGGRKASAPASAFLMNRDNAISTEIPVLSYTEEVPVLREEYASKDYYELVHFIPVSLWKNIKGQIGDTTTELYIRILGREDLPREELDALQDQICRLLGTSYTLEIENQIQAYETNNKVLQGMRVVFGCFCVLLAIIGIGDVFSNTLGFVRQRKREFARYMSIGLTPANIRKMFCIEAAVLAGRPILITLPFAVITVGYMLKMSYLDTGEFMAEAPLIPIVIFMLAILGSITLAYAFAWRNVRKINLAEVLKDDTML